MWHRLVVVWWIAVLFLLVAWSRARGVKRDLALTRLLRLGGLGLIAGLVWEWSDALPYGGIPAKVTLVAGSLWWMGYHAWSAVIPAWLLRRQRGRRLRAMVWGEDPRDLERLRWSSVAYRRAKAIAPYLRAEASAYWLARTDPMPRRQWLGVTRRCICDVAIPQDLMLRHVLILGSTGAGKTRTALQGLIEQQIARGLGLLVLQFKHDELFYRGVFEAIVHAGREGDCVYLSLRSDDEVRTAAWNPLAWPHPVEVAEAVVHATIDDLAPLRYFAAQNLDALCIILDGAIRRGEILNFTRLAELLAETGQSGAGRPLLAYLHGFPDLRSRAQKVRWEHASELKMLAARLARFPALTPIPGRASLDLRVAMQRRQVVLVNLDATTFPQAARYVGRLLVAALSAAYSVLRRTEGDPLYLVALDEFGPVAGPHLSSVLSTARGFGVSVILATQSLADLRVAGQRETAGALAAQIVENVGTQVVFGLRNPRDAEWWSAASGTVFRDYSTETLLEGNVGTETGGRLHAARHESSAVPVNKLLFAPRSKAFVWVPSRRCLRPPGGRSTRLGEELDRRDVVLANFVLPPDPPPWPDIVGGGVVIPRAASTGLESRPTAPPRPAVTSGPARIQSPPLSRLLPAGLLGPTLLGRSAPQVDTSGEDMGCPEGRAENAEPQGRNGFDRPDRETGDPGKP